VNSSVSIIEWFEQSVVHETQYFAEPFTPSARRRAIAEPMSDRDIDGV
jgi:hypothetical protein